MTQQNASLARLGFAFALFLSACGGEAPCDEYVAYMCDCHPEHAEEQCEELQTTYEDASADIQDECAYSLDEQQAEDDEEGHTCGDAEVSEEGEGEGEGDDTGT